MTEESGSSCVAAAQIPSETQCLESILSIKFSADGKLLAAVMDGRIHLLDAFNGNLLQTFYTGSAKGGPAMEATFSPDSKYLLSGAGAVRPHWHSLQNLKAVCPA